MTILPVHWFYRALILRTLLFSISQWRIYRSFKPFKTGHQAVLRLGRLHPSATLVKQFHWLPVDTRIIFKLILLTFKRYQSLLPLCLCDLLKYYIPRRQNLRSGDKKLLLQIPRASRTLGDKSFSAAAPRLWSSLHKHIRQGSTITSFKKTYKLICFPLVNCFRWPHLLFSILLFSFVLFFKICRLSFM